MIELFRDKDMTRVGHFQSLLEAEGIKTFVRNESLSVTEAAIPVFSPALCILDEADKDRAVAILQQQIQASREAVKTEVLCPSCGETNPGNFEVCWNCRQDLIESE